MFVYLYIMFVCLYIMYCTYSTLDHFIMKFLVGFDLDLTSTGGQINMCLLS